MSFHNSNEPRLCWFGCGMMIKQENRPPKVNPMNWTKTFLELDSGIEHEPRRCYQILKNQGKPIPAKLEALLVSSVNKETKKQIEDEVKELEKYPLKRVIVINEWLVKIYRSGRWYDIGEVNWEDGIKITDLALFRQIAITPEMQEFHKRVLAERKRRKGFKQQLGIDTDDT